MFTANTLFVFIVGVIIIGFIFNKVVTILNYRWRSRKPASHLSDVYDEKEYDKFQSYGRENFRLSIFSSTLMFLITIAIFMFDGFAVLDEYLRQYIESEIWLSIVFFAVIGLGSSIISIPFSVYDTFVIEQKYGFNKTTFKLFLLDGLKSLIISAIIGGGLIWIILKIYMLTQTWFWVLAWIVISLFSIFMAEFYSSLIVPLFNKQTPLEEGELRDEIARFSEKAGFKLDNIFIIDGSKRSTRANAYFTGLGKKKRIVLYDTLMDDFTTSEIVAILAHEIGHFQKRHIRKGLIMSLLNMGIVLFLFGLFIGQDVVSQALGGQSASFHLGAIAFAILYSPLSSAIGIFVNMNSRKNEREADDFAANYGYANHLIASLKKLAGKNLSNLTPHPLTVFLSYSHPPLAERVKRLLTKTK